MQEYVTDAIVLNRDENGELDARFSFFSKLYGKLKPKGKSIRKITSKLSGHLDVGNLVTVRLVEKRGLQVVDALKKSSLPISPPDLHMLNQLLGEGEADLPLWNALVQRPFRWVHILALLGWDPLEAQCAACGAMRPAHFAIHSQEFFCEACCSASRTPQNELVYVVYE